MIDPEGNEHPRCWPVCPTARPDESALALTVLREDLAVMATGMTHVIDDPTWLTPALAERWRDRVRALSAPGDGGETR